MQRNFNDDYAYIHAQCIYPFAIRFFDTVRMIPTASVETSPKHEKQTPSFDFWPRGKLIDDLVSHYWRTVKMKSRVRVGCSTQRECSS